jgi:hypothetical protein
LHAERGGIAAYSIGILNLGSARVPARSAYRKQVERIAPPELIGREAELRELAAYCTEADQAPYIWWQAPAWAGKSALMSRFVLHAPNGVRVVAFFVTARLGGQDTREAFTEVVLEQLADLLGQDLPSWPAATRDAHLLRMLEEAAEACAARGERLVLVVDGLDEDRGGAAGHDWHSIAALLPSDPPAGMRIVVAGRPHPPIPDDVPSRHRLRDPGIVRQLTSSVYAQDVKTLARQELRRFLHGTRVHQDLLGLLTAAQGGLSTPDLAALTGEPLLRIEDLLQSVSGRAFTRRVSTWQPETGPEVYLLGHEELQATAEAYFGGQRLAAYQDRLHAWVEAYRDRGWPADTPEFLLRGYFQVLVGTGDMVRLAACATDAIRHERMLDISGGDALAFNELTTAFDLVAAQDSPDLKAALRLARHRDHLADRNTDIPAPLPAVWVTLGQFARAETLARSIPDPGQRVQALAAAAEELVRAERHQQAIAVAAQAASAARSITSPGQQLRALAAAAGALARTGQHEQAMSAAARAETIAQSFHNTNIEPHGKDEALTTAAGALAGAGQHERAVAVACSIPDSSWKARALAAVAAELAQSGHLSHAVAAAAQAESAAPGSPGPLAAAAAALARTGQHEQAMVAAARAAATASGYWKGLELAEAAGALARTGQHEQAIAAAAQAMALAPSINRPEVHGTDIMARTIAAAAGALAQIGQHEQAAAAAAQAETVTRSLRFHRGLVPVAEALARTGRHEQAITTARSIPEQGLRALALTMVAGALARAGPREQAVAMAAEAETAARSRTRRDENGQALAAVAEALIRAGQHEQGITAARSVPEGAKDYLVEAAVELARAGQHEQATAMACSITTEHWRAEALEAVARALARSGQRDQAIAAVRSMTIGNGGGQMRALAGVAEELARAGQHEQAIAVARSITWPRDRDYAVSAIATDLAKRGQFEQAVTAAHSITGSTASEGALGAIARVLTQTGQYEQAAAAGCSIPERYMRRARAAMAEELAKPRQHEQAIAAAARAETAARSRIDPERKPLELALAQAAHALARAGQPEQAITAAGSINHLHIDKALAQAADALARAGQPEQAVAAAHSIVDPDGQARTLVAVAGALEANGDTTQARHVAVMACAVGQWTIPLNLVMTLDPSAVTVITGP